MKGHPQSLVTHAYRAKFAMTTPSSPFMYSGRAYLEQARGRSCSPASLLGATERPRPCTCRHVKVINAIAMIRPRCKTAWAQPHATYLGVLVTTPASATFAERYSGSHYSFLQYFGQAKPLASSKYAGHICVQVGDGINQDGLDKIQ